MDDLNEISRLRSRIESLEAENGRLARALTKGTTSGRGPSSSSLVRGRLNEVERQLEELTEAYEAASQRAESAEHSLLGVTGSPSWRLTAPLRKLKRRLRGSAS